MFVIFMCILLITIGIIVICDQLSQQQYDKAMAGFVIMILGIIMMMIQIAIMVVDLRMEKLLE